MFTQRHLDSGWREFWRSRFGMLMWILVVWIPIDWCLFAIYPNFHDPEHGKHLWQLLSAFLYPTSYLWFMWSLAAYSLLAKLAGRRRPGVVLALSGGVTLVLMGMTVWHLHHYGLTLLANDYYLRSALTFFFYFYFGYVFRDAISHLKLPALPLMMVICLFVYATLAWLTLSEMSVAVGGVVRFVAVAIGIVGAIGLGELLAAVRPVRRLFSLLGSLTLPIYLIHLVFIMPMVAWLHWLHSPVLLGMGMVPALVVALVSTLCSLAVALASSRLGFTILFVPPRWWLNLGQAGPGASRSPEAPSHRSRDGRTTADAESRRPTPGA